MDPAQTASIDLVEAAYDLELGALLRPWTFA